MSRDPGGRRVPYLLARPEQGWSSLLLLLGMLGLLGISVADSRPLELPNLGSLSGSLPAIMIAAGLIGYLLARSSLGVVRAHFMGAFVAALLLLLLTGATLLGRSPLPTDVGGIGIRVSEVWERLDADIGLLIAEELTTSVVTVFLVLGALCWTTAQFGAFSIFRYDRGGPAVLAVGTILFLNVGLNSLQAQEDRLPVVPVLALFSALALLLLMRLQLMQQRFAWARRHISDAADVSRLFMRTGAAFVAIAVISASSLTAWATVEAQEVNLDGLSEPFEDVADQLSDLLAWIGVPRDEILTQPLGTSANLKTTWEPGEGVAFTARVVGGELFGNYWWGTAYDRYDYGDLGWEATTGDRPQDVAAGSSLTPPFEATAGGSNEVDVVITVDGVQPRSNLYRPPSLFMVENHDLKARRTAGGGYSDLEYRETLEAGDTVAFTSYVRDYRPLSGVLTGNDLRATVDEDYPAWVLDSYLEGGKDPNIIGSNSQALIAQVQARGDTPYDWAVAVQDELRAMEYDPILGDACDGYAAFPECTLAIQRGFCQQYATTMVMLMRAMDVPARFVIGYLQGEPDGAGGLIVQQEALHNWVEVYFPGEGWVRFDPTPGSVLDELGQVATELDDGRPDDEPDGSPEPDLSDRPREETTPDPTLPPPPGSDSGGQDSDGTSTGVIISLGALVGLLAASVSMVLLFRLRRLPRGDDSLAYRGIVSLATRLGYGPHPAQTEYEYAGTLAEAIPGVHDDLYVVTHAQVQTTYGERELDDAHRGLLRTAYARIRTALLRLSIRGRR